MTSPPRAEFPEHAADNRHVWDANARWWDDRIGDGNEFQTWLIEPATERLLAAAPGDTILDVACGAGRMARRIAAGGARVVAFDASAAFIARARERTPADAGIEYHVADAASPDALLAFGANRFDKAVCTMALMDMPEIGPLFATLPRLLIPGGTFVFSVLHPCFLSAPNVRVAEIEDDQTGRGRRCGPREGLGLPHPVRAAHGGHQRPAGAALVFPQAAQHVVRARLRGRLRHRRLRGAAAAGAARRVRSQLARPAGHPADPGRQDEARPCVRYHRAFEARRTMTAPSAPATLAALRRLLLGLLLFGLAGTATDLLLLAHYEDAWQLIPLVLVGIAALAAIGVAAGRPVPPVVAVRLFQATMLLLIVSGAAGMVLHYRANMEFKLEMDPSLSGFALFSSVVRAKAPPALAPATLALLGLLGLTSVFRRRDDPPSGDR